jgi:hypothetical protein
MIRLFSTIDRSCTLVYACHKNGIRFITDDVMAFSHGPYNHPAYSQVHIVPVVEPSNPEAYQSSRSAEKQKMGTRELALYRLRRDLQAIDRGY